MNKSVDELREELRQAEMAELQKKQAVAREKEKAFKEATKIDVYTSDDYCGMSNGMYSFYFGYEETECPVKSHYKEELCEAHDCEKREWCFTASIGSKEVMRLRQSQCSAVESEEPFFYLLGGIAQFLNQYELQELTT